MIPRTRWTPRRPGGTPTNGLARVVHHWWYHQWWGGEHGWYHQGAAGYHRAWGIITQRYHPSWLEQIHSIAHVRWQALASARPLIGTTVLPLKELLGTTIPLPPPHTT